MRNMHFQQVNLERGAFVAAASAAVAVLLLLLPRPANGIALLPARLHSHKVLPPLSTLIESPPDVPSPFSACSRRHGAQRVAGKAQLNCHWSLTFSACCRSPVGKELE